jgi:DNA replication protein DnaC
MTGALMAEDLDSPAPGADECQRCGFNHFECLCSLRRPNRQPTVAEIERARERRRSASLDEEITRIRDVVVAKNADGKPTCECGAVLEGACFQCAACARSSEADRKKRELTVRFEAWREEIRGWAPLTGVPDWEWARLDNPDFTRRIRFPRLLAYAQKYEPCHGSVFISSDTGTGKTTLTRAAVQRLKEREIAKVLSGRPGSRPTSILWTLRDLVWTTGFELAKARRENSLGDGEARLVERAMSCKFLVLDECGFEVLHDTVFQEIMNSRYVAELPTIVTSGLRPEAFAKRYGDAAFRRLTERGTVLESW